MKTNSLQSQNLSSKEQLYWNFWEDRQEYIIYDEMYSYSCRTGGAIMIGAFGFFMLLMITSDLWVSSKIISSKEQMYLAFFSLLGCMGLGTLLSHWYVKKDCPPLYPKLKDILLELPYLEDIFEFMVSKTPENQIEDLESIQYLIKAFKAKKLTLENVQEFVRLNREIQEMMQEEEAGSQIKQELMTHLNPQALEQPNRDEKFLEML